MCGKICNWVGNYFLEMNHLLRLFVHVCGENIKLWPTKIEPGCVMKAFLLILLMDY